MISKKTTNILLYFILVLASVLRFSGASPGYPPYHSDEGITYSAAVSMIENENLDPLRYDYPAIVPLTNYFTYKHIFIPLAWLKYYITHMGDYIDGFVKFPLDQVTKERIFKTEIIGERAVNAMFWGRYTTAFLGVGVVFLLYKVGTKLISKEVGLLGAFFLAINYRHVLNSHIGLPDIYNSFFLLLSFLGSLHVLQKPTTRNYVVASILAGISLATKYQFFSFFPLLLVHLYVGFSKKDKKAIYSHLFRKEAFLVPVIIVFVFILVNPYAYIKIEETIDWLVFVSGKYRTGKNSFDFYPYSYLYHFGIGKAASVLVVLGVFVALLKDVKFFLLPFSVVFFFFLVTTYMTGGGFYTRNFVSIIPFLLLFASWGLIEIVKMIPKKIGYIATAVIVLFVAHESLSKSIVVATEYRDTWNYKIVEEWIEKNIPDETKIAAHSSVPLKNESHVRIPYEPTKLFTIEEFRKEGANYAVMNTEWSTIDFYGWMTEDTKTSLAYWEKPVRELEDMFSALAIREFQDFGIYSVVNSSLASDSSFVVSVIPQYEFARRELMRSFYLDEEKPITMRSWESDIVNLGDWNGLEVSYTLSNTQRDGFVIVEFFETKEDAEVRKNRVAVRLSARQNAKEWQTFSFPIAPVENAKFAKVSVGSYQKEPVFIKKIDIFSASVKPDYYGWNPENIELETDLVFPNSHGNL